MRWIAANRSVFRQKNPFCTKIVNRDASTCPHANSDRTRPNCDARPGPFCYPERTWHDLMKPCANSVRQDPTRLNRTVNPIEQLRACKKITYAKLPLWCRRPACVFPGRRDACTTKNSPSYSFTGPKPRIHKKQDPAMNHRTILPILAALIPFVLLPTARALDFPGPAPGNAIRHRRAGTMQTRKPRHPHRSGNWPPAGFAPEPSSISYRIRQSPPAMRFFRSCWPTGAPSAPPN